MIFLGAAKVMYSWHAVVQWLMQPCYHCTVTIGYMKSYSYFLFQQEKKLAENQSSYLNAAYFTLLKPLSRGLYLLELHGEALEEGTVEMDSDFLMEIMDLNEQIAEANDKETVIKLGKDNLHMLEKMERKPLPSSHCR